MNRELKFRAWDGEKMRYDVTGFEHGVANEMAGIFLDGDFYRMSETPVMQFTGLLDEKKVEIWESDVIEFRESLWIIKWSDQSAGFFLWQKDHPGYLLEDHIGVIVRGNIHEHPELLSPIGI